MLFVATIDAALTITNATDPAAARAQVGPTLYLLGTRGLGIDPTSAPEV